MKFLVLLLWLVSVTFTGAGLVTGNLLLTGAGLFCTVAGMLVVIIIAGPDGDGWYKEK